jgi:WD40 repeat protein
MGPDLFASVGYSDRISLWSVSSGQEMGYLGAGEDAAALCIAAGPDGVTLATGGTAEDRRVRLWEPATGEMVVLGFHDSLVESVAFSPSGKWLASGDNGDRVRIWDLDKRLPETSFQGDVSGRLQSFHNLFWLDDGTLLAAGSDAVYSWDVETGKLLGRLDRPGRAPFLVDVALHPAGGRLAGAAQDGAVYIWDRSTPAWSAWPAPQGLSVTKVQFSPDGQLLAAATQEGELLLWGVEVGGGVNPPLLARYPVVSGSIAAIRFSPDGRIIAVGGWDSPIWLWGIAP